MAIRSVQVHFLTEVEKVIKVAKKVPMISFQFSNVGEIFFDGSTKSFSFQFNAQSWSCALKDKGQMVQQFWAVAYHDPNDNNKVLNALKAFLKGQLPLPLGGKG